MPESSIDSRGDKKNNKESVEKIDPGHNRRRMRGDIVALIRFLRDPEK